MDILKILNSIYFFLFSGSLLYILYFLFKFVWFYQLEEPITIKLTDKEKKTMWVCCTILFVAMIKGILI
jgi:hypothetical protein